MDKMEDIERVLAGVAGGVAADEGVRYLAKERPSEFAQSIIADVSGTVVPWGMEEEKPLEPKFLRNTAAGSPYYVLQWSGKPGMVYGLVYLNIHPEKFWIEAYRTTGSQVHIFYKGEEIALDEPARGVKGVER